MTSPEIKKLLKNILFIDIETVPAQASYKNLDSNWQKLWDYKASFLKNDDQKTASELYERAGIYAEFGKVICIGLGFFYWNEEDEICLKTKIIAQESEAETLAAFNMILESKFKKSTVQLCAHNGKEFDFPYLCRRMVVNGVSLPKALQIADKKPWEIDHFDTMEMWKFGDKKQYTSLDLLANLFEIDSSKVTMAGNEVAYVYYNEKNLPKIEAYCREDVIVLAQLFCKFKNITLPDPLQIERV